MPLKRAASVLLAFSLAMLTATLLPGEGIAQRSTDDLLRAAKADIDALSEQRDDARRLAGVQQFLKDHPDNYWRHLAYRLWLFSSWRLGDLSELQKAADAYIKEYPSSGAAYGSVSRYLYEARALPDVGYPHAQRARELFEHQLGIDGSLGSMLAVQERTSSLPPQAVWMPPSERDNFINYLGSRFNLARYELNRGQRRLALAQLEPVIALDPFTVDEEETLAPFFFVQGQIYESLNQPEEAYRAYLSALVVGDAQNRYASQAQSRLQPVGEQAGKGAREAILRSMVPAAVAQQPLVRFTDVTSAAGLSAVAGSRAAWGDVDGDNDADLLIDGSTLLINQGSGFSDGSEEWGLKAGRNAGLFADVDNDGDLDVYSLGNGSRENRLLRNQGNRLVDVTVDTSSTAPAANSTAAGWLDFDRDGWVDIYVAGLNGVSRILAERGDPVAPDALLRNVEGSLRQASEAAAGIAAARETPAAGTGVSVADGDGDGDLDLFVANREGAASYLWTNKGGTFVDLAAELGIIGESRGRFAASSAADWGDVDNDGDLDLFVCNWSKADERANYLNSAFYFQQGDGFVEQRADKNIRAGTVLTEPLFADFNNDGHLDLYLTSSGSGQRSFLYVNDGHGGWHDMTYLSSGRVLGGQGSAVADFDRDGDLDVVVCTGRGVRLLRNDTTKQNWLQIRVVGAMGAAHPDDGKPWSNAAGIGTRVTLSMGAEKFVREIQSGKGSGCGNELIAHFGLGARRGRMTVTVRFPSGREVTRAFIEAGQRYEIRETDGGSAIQRPEQPPATPVRGLGR